MPRTLVMATRSAAEAEPVLIEANDGIVRLELDDGEVLDFDLVELLAALRQEAA